MVLTGRITFFAKPIGRLYRPFAQCRETYTKASMKSLHQKEMQMSRVALSFFASQSSLLSTVLHRAFPWEPELYRAVSLDFLAFGPSWVLQWEAPAGDHRKGEVFTHWMVPCEPWAESHGSCQALLCFHYCCHVWLLETTAAPEPLWAFAC